MGDVAGAEGASFMRMLRRIALFCLGVVAVGAALTARVVLDGQAELRKSDAAFDQGELRPALEHARQSATLYAPGAPHVDRAYERMIAIALGAESAGQPKLAFQAWQAVRSAALESRHLWITHARELERANQNLARLEVLARSANAEESSKLQLQAEARLAADSAPDPAWIAALGSGFLLALAGLGVFSFQGVDRTGRVSPGRAQLGLLLFVIGAALWAFAAYKA